MNIITTPPAPRIDTPKRTLKTRSSCITLWKPGIVLAQAGCPIAPQAPVALGEPGLRPEAVRAQIEATRALLASLQATRTAFGAESAATAEREAEVDSEAGRVSTMMENYRMKTRLEDALRGALREITALMEEHGLR